jgi:transcription antitermination factor NusG
MMFEIPESVAAPDITVSDIAAPATDIIAPATADPVAPPWFAIWTRSRAESSVAEQLDRKKIEVFLPTIQRWSRWKDRKKMVEWPLFPGYCFARFDRRAALDVRKCVGVATIISFDGQLAEIPSAEIEAIQRVVKSDLKFDPCPLIHEGDTVEVIHGPLKGMTGQLIHKGATSKLIVSVVMINRAVAIEFDAADVRKF